MDVFALLRTGNSRRASDLHMVVGSPATLRIDGSLAPANGAVPLTPEDVSEAFLQLTTPEEREEFHRQLELDFGYTLPDVGRLRCNAAQQRGSISLAVRLLPPKIPTLDELEMPAQRTGGSYRTYRQRQNHQHGRYDSALEHSRKSSCGYN